MSFRHRIHNNEDTYIFHRTGTNWLLCSKISDQDDALNARGGQSSLPKMVTPGGDIGVT
jgi:hypothetical protein